MSHPSQNVDVAMQLLATLPSWSQARHLYEKGGMLGAGTFATVFAAQITQSSTPVALKQVFLQKPAAKGRADHHPHGDPVDAAREVLALQALQAPHPHVVQTHSIYYDDQGARLIIAAESCRGNLKHHLDSSMGIISLELVQLFCGHLLLGLAHCHSHRVLHRDIKPANLLITTAPGTCQLLLKIADFGSSVMVPGTSCGGPSPTTASEHNFFKNLNGVSQATFPILAAELANMTPLRCTYFYAAPEVLAGSCTYTYSSDVWSAGAVAGELLVGRPIFGSFDSTERGMLDAIRETIGLDKGTAVIMDGRDIAVGTVQGLLQKAIHQNTDGFAMLESLMQWCPARRASAKVAAQQPFCTSVVVERTSPTPASDTQQQGADASSMTPPPPRRRRLNSKQPDHDMKGGQAIGESPSPPDVPSEPTTPKTCVHPSCNFRQRRCSRYCSHHRLPPVLVLIRSMSSLLNQMIPSDVTAFLDVLPSFKNDLALEVLGILIKEPTALREFSRLIQALPESYTAEELMSVLHQVPGETGGGRQREAMRGVT